MKWGKLHDGDYLISGSFDSSTIITLNDYHLYLVRQRSKIAQRKKERPNKKGRKNKVFFSLLCCCCWWDRGREQRINKAFRIKWL